MRGVESMQLRKQLTACIPGKAKTRRWYGLAYWPDDVVGWLRIPSLIMFCIGILGTAKYTWPVAARYLKSINLPAIEFCWLMLIAGGTVYLLSLISWLFFEDIRKNCRPSHDIVTAPGQWRSM